METANILKVIVYPVIMSLSYILVRNDWFSFKRQLAQVVTTQRLHGKRKHKIRWSTIIFISVIIGIYSLSFNQTFWWGDVANYSRAFSYGLPAPSSAGLNMIYGILHLFTTNIDVLLFVVATTTTFLALLAYRWSEDAQPTAILFLFATSFFIDTCQIHLKQAIACSLAYLFVCAMLKKKYFVAIIFVILAVLFHETALILVCLFILLINIENTNIRRLLYLVVIVAVIFFREFSAIILFLVTAVIPNIASEVSVYLDESGNIVSDSYLMTALKGIPFYFITIIGFIKRKNLKLKINYYDKYLVVSVLCSAVRLLSAHTYWMSRFTSYFYLPCTIFISLIISNITNYKERMWVAICAFTFFVLLTGRLLLMMYL